MFRLFHKVSRSELLHLRVEDSQCGSTIKSKFMFLIFKMRQNAYKIFTIFRGLHPGPPGLNTGINEPQIRP